MERLIDANSLHQNMVFAEFDTLQDRLLITEMINHAPTVEAAPVVHGRWDHNGNCTACNTNMYNDIDADFWSSYEPPYCPNCGAKMNLEEM